MCVYRFLPAMLMRGFSLLLLVLLAACSTTAPSALTQQQSPTSTPHPAVQASPSPRVAGDCRSALAAIPGPLLEAQGKAVGGEVWALFFNTEFRVNKEMKIVWRITGEGDFQAVAIDADGRQVKPVWGPTYHTSSSWHRPGQEWGTGFTLPRPGCWDLHITRNGITWEGAVRGRVTGDVFLLIH